MFLAICMIFVNCHLPNFKNNILISSWNSFLTKVYSLCAMHYKYFLQFAQLSVLCLAVFFSKIYISLNVKKKKSKKSKKTPRFYAVKSDNIFSMLLGLFYAYVGCFCPLLYKYNFYFLLVLLWFLYCTSILLYLKFIFVYRDKDQILLF